MFVRRLREKVDERASRHTFIQTRYGVGYKLEAVPKDRAAAAGRRRIQNLDTARGEALEVGLPLLHPVERLADVEPPQRDVPRLEEAESVARR